MSDAGRIASVFSRAKSEDRLAFIPFVAFGDPDGQTSLALIRALAACHVDLIEVGFPYSDPIADGPVIQASYTRALQNGMHVHDILGGIRSLQSPQTAGPLPPLVAMVSYAIVFRQTPAAFVQNCAEAGFSGLIVPDLPADEADEMAETVRAAGMDLIQLISPTTPAERARRILKGASGFVYCISVAGTTGARNRLPTELQRQLKELRSMTDLPLAVGFGISKPEQMRALHGAADGAIVGSAIVGRLAPLANGTANADEVIRDISEYASCMLAAAKA